MIPVAAKHGPRELDRLAVLVAGGALDLKRRRFWPGFEQVSLAEVVNATPGSTSPTWP